MFGLTSTELTVFQVAIPAVVIAAAIVILETKTRNKTYNAAQMRVAAEFFTAEVIKKAEYIIFTADAAFTVTNLSNTGFFLSGVSLNVRLPDMLKSPVIIRKEFDSVIKADQTVKITKRFEARLSENEFKTLTDPKAETSLKIFAKIWTPSLRNHHREEEIIAGTAIVQKPDYKIFE